MALQKIIEIPAGINLTALYPNFNHCTKTILQELENAYIKIDNQSGNKDRVFLSIGIYNKKNGQLVMNDSFDFIPDTARNFIKQGYEQLKNNKYQDAVDLLDEGQTA